MEQKSIPFEAIESDQTARIDRDIACRQCGYNLRSLATDARCPECGTAVALSLQGDWLRFAAPRWLMTIRMGLILAMMGSLFIFIGFLANYEPFAGRNAILLLAAAGLAMIATAAWFLGVGDPAEPVGSAPGRRRSLMRALLTVAICLRLVVLIYVPTSLLPRPPVWLTLCSIMCGLCIAAGIGLVLLNVRQLVQRLPNRPLAGMSLGLGIGLSTVLAGYYCIYAIVLPLVRLSAGGSETAIFLLAGVWEICRVGAMIGWLLCCILFAAALAMVGEHLAMSKGNAQESRGPG